MMNKRTSNDCPCGSNRLYLSCCGHYIENDTPAPTAEKLMRSRYSAYTRSNSRYLLNSWHATTRPSSLDLNQTLQPDWLVLKVCRTEAGNASDSNGTVEFIARYRENGSTEVIHEISRFVKEGGHWFYLDGTLSQPTQNGLCPCGGGKKFKRCCGK